MDVKLANYIDHTLLKPNANRENIKQLIKEAIEYEFASVCVNPHWVSYCYKNLKDTPIKVCTVIGFPLGATSTETKVFEAIRAIKDGATEVDMVLNIGELKSSNDVFVEQDIEAVIKAVNGKALIKIIIETSLLTRDEKIRACTLAKNADFVKTSTGFSNGGATVKDIQLIRQLVGPNKGIKASGGVGDLETARKMIAAGATRIGASAGVDIIKEEKKISDH